MLKAPGIILGIVLGITLPAVATAQPKPDAAKKGAPARSAPRPAPHPVMHAPAPHPMVRAAPRSVPHVAPHPVVRAAPHPAPHIAPRQAARPQPHAAPSAAHAVPREQRRVQSQPHNGPRVIAVPQRTAAPQTTRVATPQMTRAAARQERALRRQEDRSLRGLPPSQRAARREEIRHAREQRAQQRQPATPNTQAQPNAQIRRDAQRGPRRNGQSRVAAQAARQGRFGAAFAQAPATTQQRDARRRRWSAHDAWRHHTRAPFVAWYGPVFWPYAYADVFDYTFWPDGYDDGYWAYAYDDFIDGLFWGEEGPPAEYVDATPPAGTSAPPPVRYAAVQELCKQPGNGVTAWPVAEIEKKVGLNAEQKQLLADMRRDAAKAADAFKTSCPSENAFPLTPPGRLAAMTERLQATLDAVDTVKPALNAFYNSLSDEQKERFNEIGPAPKGTAATTAQASTDAGAPNCKQPKPGLATLPIEKIEDVVKPTDVQEAELNKLQDATNQAVGMLQAACPDETPLTPPGRLDAMEARLKAMIDAANTVKPALAAFYDTLSNEQKARFNRMGQELAAAND